MFVCMLALAQHPARAAGTASIAGLYPAAEVPIGATVTFSINTSGFTNPTYYLVDSFPGGATSGNVDSSGNFSWTPNKNETGTHTLTITVSDSQGNSASVSQQIIVDGTPTLSIQSLVPGTSVNIGTPITFSVSSYGLFSPTYAAGDSFSNSSLMQSAMNGAGVFSWTPIAQDAGAHTITVTAKDAYSNTATVSTPLTVFPPTSISITGLSPGASVNAGNTFSFTATSTGFFNPAYNVWDAFNGVSTSTTMIVGPTGNTSWTPVYNDIGVHAISLVASDNTGRSATTTVSITVLPPLPAPVTQTVAPATSTSTPATQTAAPAAPAKSQTTSTQTPASVGTKKTTPPPVVVQNTSTSHSPFQTFPTSMTPTTTTSAAHMASTGPIAIPEESPIVIPPNTPTESMVGFFFHSTINFFVSIFKLL